ncbi:hypothetical protein [Tunturibacter empetritectus]|uniref:DUF1579 domain-containing protein n=1 Tax=Tunturiibacter empetritectus TaxID=3069691 RepID=A0A7W8MRH1_9BACT|nr:hypothetical protein [Edaphobacter lichenicola]MBB5316780.1 hypothetical protein [Edaphobacter lichenicola]
MITRKLMCLLLALLYLSPRSESQSASSQQNLDIYKNFIGRWIGYNETLQNGSLKRVPLELLVTEEKDGKSIRVDYTYGRKGDDGFERQTRYIELRPEKAEMILHWKGEEREKFQTDGLEQFAENGLGKFVAQQKPSGNGQKVIYRATFELQPKTFSYVWERSGDGQKYGITGTFSFTRDTGEEAKK